MSNGDHMIPDIAAASLSQARAGGLMMMTLIRGPGSRSRVRVNGAARLPPGAGRPWPGAHAAGRCRAGRARARVSCLSTWARARRSAGCSTL
jgi:hypothetical protein